MIPIEPFCTDWHRYRNRPETEARLYVADEIRRLDGEGKPLLTVLLQCTEDVCQQIALEILHTNNDGKGKRVFKQRLWTLRLVKDAVPPHSDPQGRLLPDEKRGKVLVAKTGNLGGELPPDRTVEQHGEWEGQKRDTASRTGREIYRTVEITREGETLTIDEALTVLRQWGVGIQQRQYRRPAGWRPRAENSDERGQCQWLVEEVPPERPQPTATKPKRDAAQPNA